MNPATATLPSRRSASGTLVARTKVAPACCVHVLTDQLEGITPQTPRPGRVDCPEKPELHEKDVTVIGIAPDGKGGMVAMFRLAPTQGHLSASAVIAARQQNALSPVITLPVCTVGKQDGDVVPCCLVAGSAGEPIIKCDDPQNGLHGQPASVAVRRGITLELCPPPVQVPPCCVELGNFGGKNARIVCEDEKHAAHGKPVNVEVSPDGTSAVLIIGDAKIEVPICETVDIPFEIPCCVKSGVLECPGTPYHGLSYDEVVKKFKVKLLPCKETPPQLPIPPDCCVKREGNRYFLVCASDPSGLLNGLELDPDKVKCQGNVCHVTFTIPGKTWVENVPMPLCDGGREQIPPDCCFDVATSTLVCTDKASEWNGLKVKLIDLQSHAPHGAGVALVWHELFGSVPKRFPICEVEVPGDCCFEPADKPRAGITGKLRCKSTSDLDGRDATLVDVRVMPDGSMVGNIAFLGGTARMLLCKHPPKECPDCPPPYFCCVNLDTGLFVCPANDARHGRPAKIREVRDVGGAAWAVLEDGQMVPGCGTKCPGPEPCKPPGLIPTPPGECPPGADIPFTPPDMPGRGPGTPGDCPPGSDVPMGPPNMPGRGPGTPGDCPPGSDVPMGPPNMPGRGPGTPGDCPPGSDVPMGPPNIPGEGPGTPSECYPTSSISFEGPNMPGEGPGTPSCP